MIARKIEVRGVVQGVWFRASCRDEALRLEVRGWVANRNDGSVWAHFEGDPRVVQAMLDWCQVGPPGAIVRDVVIETTDPEDHASFEIR